MGDTAFRNTLCLSRFMNRNLYVLAYTGQHIDELVDGKQFNFALIDFADSSSSYRAKPYNLHQKCQMQSLTPAECKP